MEYSGRQMKYLVILNATVAFAGLCGFIYGAVRYFKPLAPLYAIMTVFGVGCSMLGRVYQFIRLFTGGEITGVFQVGILGVIGAFSFLFSVNFGQIDSLVDDGTDVYKKYRVMGLIGPVSVAALYLPVLLSDASLAVRISYAVAAVFIALAAYYNVKHLLIEDVEFGVVMCLRPFNAIVFLYGILCMTEMIAFARGMDALLIVSDIMIAGILILIIPVMEQGVKKWMS